MRVRSVQLGGSLAGKLSSELSSTLSDKSVALGISGRRLRRPLVEPRIMDRGVTERCPEAERMNSALRMIQRLAVAAHRSPYRIRGTALVPSAFRLEKRQYRPHPARRPPTSAQLQVRAEQNRRHITPKRNLNPASALIVAVYCAWGTAQMRTGLIISAAVAISLIAAAGVRGGAVGAAEGGAGSARPAQFAQTPESSTPPAGQSGPDNPSTAAPPAGPPSNPPPGTPAVVLDDQEV